MASSGYGPGHKSVQGHASVLSTSCPWIRAVHHAGMRDVRILSYYILCFFFKFLPLCRRLAAEIQAIKEAETAAAEAELKRQEGRKRREVRLILLPSTAWPVTACNAGLGWGPVRVMASSRAWSTCPGACQAAQKVSNLINFSRTTDFSKCFLIVSASSFELDSFTALGNEDVKST